MLSDLAPAAESQAEDAPETLTVLARMPPKLEVSYPKSMSPTRRQKQENMSIGVTMDHPERVDFAIVAEDSVRYGHRSEW